MISFPALRCSRHWPTLQAPCLGCQFNWENVSPVVTDSARRSAASNSERMRNDHFGKPEAPVVDTRQNNAICRFHGKAEGAFRRRLPGHKSGFGKYRIQRTCPSYLAFGSESGSGEELIAS